MSLRWLKVLLFLWLSENTRVTAGGRLDITPVGPTLATPGQLVTILCTAPAPLTYCRFSLPRLAAPITLNIRSRPSEHYRYYGRGLQYGHCGITLEAVEEGDNGVVGCAAGVEDDTEEVTNNMTLIIVRRPGTPELRVSSTTHRAGDLLHASCLIPDGRPPPNITWSLDDVTRSAVVSDVTLETDYRRDTHSVGGNLTYRLDWRDDGLVVTCRAGHVTMGVGGEEAAVKIRVKFGPRATEQQGAGPSLVIGQRGVIAVRLSANPQPALQWLFGDRVALREGESDSNGRIHAARIVKEGPSRWRAELIYDTVRTSDFGLYVLVATNDEGNEKFPLFATERLNNRYYENNGTISRVSSADATWIVFGIEAAILVVFVAISTAAIVQGRRRQREDEKCNDE